MNSATSTERASGDSGFRPWHVYILLSMVAATVAVMLTRQTHPVALLLLSGMVVAAGGVGLMLHQALMGFAGAQDVAEAPPSDRTREMLERDKMLVLRAIKELDFDHSMDKVSDADFQDLRGRLRARAIALMTELDGGPAPAVGAEPTPRPVTALRCTTCDAVNEDDARFCKRCGKALHADA